MVIGVLSPELKRPGRGVNHSLSSNTKVKNEWSYTSTSPTCIHGVDRAISTFIPFISIWVFGFLLQAPLFCVILGFRRCVDAICTLGMLRTQFRPSRCPETSVQNYHSALHKIQGGDIVYFTSLILHISYDLQYVVL